MRQAVQTRKETPAIPSGKESLTLGFGGTLIVFCRREQELFINKELINKPKSRLYELMLEFCVPSICSLFDPSLISRKDHFRNSVMKIREDQEMFVWLRDILRISKRPAVLLREKQSGRGKRLTATLALTSHLVLHVLLYDFLHQHVGQGLEVRRELLVLFRIFLLLHEQLEEGLLLPARPGDVSSLLGDAEQLPENV